MLIDSCTAAAASPDLDEPGGISMLEWLQPPQTDATAPSSASGASSWSAPSTRSSTAPTPAIGIDVFWKAFFPTARGYRMGVPVVPLADLYDGCRAAIEQKGGEVALRAAGSAGCRSKMAALLPPCNSTANAKNLPTPSSSLFLTASFAELCRPKLRSRRRLPQPRQSSKTLPSLASIFWFDREVMNEPFITLLDTTTQWIFNKTALYGIYGAANGEPQIPSLTNGAVPATRHQRIL